MGEYDAVYAMIIIVARWESGFDALYRKNTLPVVRWSERNSTFLELL